MMNLQTLFTVIVSALTTWLVVRVFGSRRDTTHAARLRRAEKDLHQVMSANPDYLWNAEISATGKITNRSFYGNVEQITGRPPEFFERGHGFDSVHPADRPRVMDTVASLGSGAVTKADHEYRIVRPDGTVRWVQGRIVSSTRTSGRMRLHGVVSDVTDRRTAETAQQEFADRSHLLLESVMDALVLMADGHIVYANSATARIFGYDSRQELVGRPANDLLAPVERERSDLRSQELLAGGAPRPSEYLAVRKDSSLFPVEASARRIPYEGGYALATVIRDMSERRHLQEQLTRAQKMEAVGRLAGGVAHDFNNLLTIIQGYASLQLKRMTDDDPLRRSAEKIRTATDQAAGVVRRLLALGRKQVVKPIALDLSDVIRDSEGMLRRLLGEPIGLSTRLAPDLIQVMADRGQIDQVLLNLTINARDAMMDGGEVRISTTNTTLEPTYRGAPPGATPGPSVQLRVSDTGHGMSEETRLQIFEPFFTTKGPRHGTGLGLSTVYSIVEQAGGFIEVASQEGVGTTFTVWFPATSEALAPGQPLASLTREARSRESVLLVVEDETDVREMVCDFLRESGYHVLSAGDGNHALRLAESHSGPIDLLVADVVMPGMSGRDLADRLKSLRPEMRVLFMSGYTPDTVLRHGVRNHDTSLLPKPFTLEELSARVVDTLHESLDIPVSPVATMQTARGDWPAASSDAMN
jgi:PAS domain S-box-containing protein